jgi:hypothetical protein
MPNNNYTRTKEKALTNKLTRLFRKQKKELISQIQTYEKKSFFDFIK